MASSVTKIQDELYTHNSVDVPLFSVKDVRAFAQRHQHRPLDEVVTLFKTHKRETWHITGKAVKRMKKLADADHLVPVAAARTLIKYNSLSPLGLALAFVDMAPHWQLIQKEPYIIVSNPPKPRDSVRSQSRPTDLSIAGSPARTRTRPMSDSQRRASPRIAKPGGATQPLSRGSRSGEHRYNLRIR